VASQSQKEHSINISTSVIISWLTIGGFAWLFAEPLLVNAVSAALADDIKQTVDESVAPINGAFIALLVRDINNTKREIAALNFRKDHRQDWTAKDAGHLADLEIDLAALEAAKKSLETPRT